MNRGFRIFDSHVHAGHARNGRSYSVDDLLRDMDRAGVDRSLVIPFPLVEDWRGEHDLIGAAVRAHPDRLSGAVCYSPSVTDREFRHEARRCREVYGFVAAKLQPQYHGLNPFAGQSGFFFEAALENGMAAICHTGSGLPFATPSLLMMPARRYPALKIVAAHCGGGIFHQEAIVAATFCANVFLELSSLMPYHVLAVLREVPSDRLMIGSDLPENLDTEIGKILALDIDEQAKRDILSATAERLFGPACG